MVLHWETSSAWAGELDIISGQHTRIMAPAVPEKGFVAGGSHPIVATYTHSRNGPASSEIEVYIIRATILPRSAFKPLPLLSQVEQRNHAHIYLYIYISIYQHIYISIYLYAKYACPRLNGAF